MAPPYGNFLIYNGEFRHNSFDGNIPSKHAQIVEVRNDAVAGRAIWKVTDGRFYLVDINGTHNIIGMGPVFADWFSAVISVGYQETTCAF